MLKKITTADARKKFANIINQVAFGNESFVLTRRGEPIAAIVSMNELKLLQDLEDRIDCIFRLNRPLVPEYFGHQFQSKSAT